MPNSTPPPEQRRGVAATGERDAAGWVTRLLALLAMAGLMWVLWGQLRPVAWPWLPGSPDPVSYDPAGDLLREAGQGLSGTSSVEFQKAEMLTRQALEMDPLRSEGWMTLSKALLKQGQNVRAGEALEVALRLDPGWQGQATGALQHAVLTGRTDIAEALVRNMVKQQVVTAELVAYLLRLRWPVPRIFDELQLAQRSPSEARGLLLTIHRGNRTDGLRSVWEKLPQEWLRDPTLVNDMGTAARLAGDIAMHEALYRVFHGAPKPMPLPPQGEASTTLLALVNLSLETLPWELPQVGGIGWAAPPTHRLVKASWRAPQVRSSFTMLQGRSEPGQEPGEIAIELSGQSDETGAEFRWRLVTVYIPAKTPAVFRFEIATENLGSNAPMQLGWEFGRGVERRPVLGGTTRGWETMEFKMAASDELTSGTFVAQMGGRNKEQRGRGTLRLRGFKLEAIVP